ncbi:gene transfer agent family protein [Fuscibacter oryzae]|uniref:Gene transfer agent family protein n=1 Tax=Fuscibacter oryzae TaxID=2803939 RepID=A0A8J7SSU7_9RHOB|nr:gene transfer agent family protein [Fuscibacter oryzae]MBL4927995.1 gene transfer agent family protein [Fuscibacter oryzae]
MTDQITHRAFFGDRERTFILTDPMLAELEKLTGLGVGALYLQLVGMAYPAEALREIIRLGLIGAGTTPEDAKRLCDAYASNRPLVETFPLAFEIMEARWNGKAEQVAA